MEINSNLLLDDLITRIKNTIPVIASLKEKNISFLNYRTEPNSWSVLECIEHLNRYGDFYLPEIEKRMAFPTVKAATTYYKPGLLGNYFVKMMLPQNNKIKKIKSPKDKNPINTAIEASVIDIFLQQQHTLLQLLEKAKHINLDTTKTAISISNFIKLKLGDTLRFFVYHIERHLQQIKNIEPKRLDQNNKKYFKNSIIFDS
jgi:hypothetical protein